MGDALHEAQHDPDVRAVVITGAGRILLRRSRSQGDFAAGEPVSPRTREWGFAGYVQHVIDKPTIAAVNGTALGGGTELALASDLVVAEERANSVCQRSSAA